MLHRIAKSKSPTITRVCHNSSLDRTGSCWRLIQKEIPSIAILINNKVLHAYESTKYSSIAKITSEQKFVCTKTINKHQMDIATAAKRDEFLRESFIMSIIRLLIKNRCKDNVFICHNQSKYTSGSHSAGAFQSMLYSSLKISFMRAQII